MKPTTKAHPLEPGSGPSATASGGSSSISRVRFGGIVRFLPVSLGGKDKTVSPAERLLTELRVAIKLSLMTTGRMTRERGRETRKKRSFTLLQQRAKKKRRRELVSFAHFLSSMGCCSFQRLLAGEAPVPALKPTRLAANGHVLAKSVAPKPPPLQGEREESLSAYRSSRFVYMKSKTG